MHVWICERVLCLSELKANKKSRRPPHQQPASVEETKADGRVVSEAALSYQPALRHPALIINWFVWAKIQKTQKYNHQDHRNNHKMMKHRLGLENNESTTARATNNLHLKTSLSLSMSPPPDPSPDLQMLNCWGSSFILWGRSTCSTWFETGFVFFSFLQLEQKSP